MAHSQHTTQADDTADVVVIGGGIVGASVAYHLAARGCTNVIIVERAAQQGLGSTGRATGGGRAQFATDINIQMSRYSLAFLARFKEATGVDAGYDPVGYLFLATDEQQLAYLRQTRERQHAAGLTNVELLAPADIARLVPQLRTDDLCGASFCPTDGLLAPLAIMRGFTARATERGVRLWLDTNVTGLELAADAIAAVHTTRGRISTRVVVNAAGAWAATVAGFAGVALPVTPLRRQLVATAPFAGLPARTPMVIDMSDGFHFRRDATTGPPPGLLLAWPDPAEQPGFNTDFDPAFSAKVLARAAVRVPCLAAAVPDPPRCRAGLYEMTPDHHAIIGRAPGVAGFYLANGFSGHGVMHSPATGRLVAELILDGRASLLDITPLAPERFATGQLQAETSYL